MSAKIQCETCQGELWLPCPYCTGNLHVQEIEGEIPHHPDDPTKIWCPTCLGNLTEIQLMQVSDVSRYSTEDLDTLWARLGRRALQNALGFARAALQNPNISPSLWKECCIYAPDLAWQCPALPMFLLEDSDFLTSDLSSSSVPKKPMYIVHLLRSALCPSELWQSVFAFYAEHPEDSNDTLVHELASSRLCPIDVRESYIKTCLDSFYAFFAGVHYGNIFVEENSFVRLSKYHPMFLERFFTGIQSLYTTIATQRRPADANLPNPMTPIVQEIQDWVGDSSRSYTEAPWLLWLLDRDISPRHHPALARFLLSFPDLPTAFVDQAIHAILQYDVSGSRHLLLEVLKRQSITVDQMVWILDYLYPDVELGLRALCENPYLDPIQMVTILAQVTGLFVLNLGLNPVRDPTLEGMRTEIYQGRRYDHLLSRDTPCTYNNIMLALYGDWVGPMSDPGLDTNLLAVAPPWLHWCLFLNDQQRWVTQSRYVRVKPSNRTQMGVGPQGIPFMINRTDGTLHLSLQYTVGGPVLEIQVQPIPIPTVTYLRRVYPVHELYGSQWESWFLEHPYLLLPKDTRQAILDGVPITLPCYQAYWIWKKCRDYRGFGRHPNPFYYPLEGET